MNNSFKAGIIYFFSGIFLLYFLISFFFRLWKKTNRLSLKNLKPRPKPKPESELEIEPESKPEPESDQTQLGNKITFTYIEETDWRGLKSIQFSYIHDPSKDIDDVMTQDIIPEFSQYLPRYFPDIDRELDTTKAVNKYNMFHGIKQLLLHMFDNNWYGINGMVSSKYYHDISIHQEKIDNNKIKITGRLWEKESLEERERYKKALQEYRKREQEEEDLSDDRSSFDDYFDDEPIPEKPKMTEEEIENLKKERLKINMKIKELYEKKSTTKNYQEKFDALWNQMLEFNNQIVDQEMDTTTKQRKKLREYRKERNIILEYMKTTLSEIAAYKNKITKQKEFKILIDLLQAKITLENYKHRYFQNEINFKNNSDEEEKMIKINLSNKYDDLLEKIKNSSEKDQFSTYLDEIRELEKTELIFDIFVKHKRKESYKDDILDVNIKKPSSIVYRDPPKKLGSIW